jgi:hypothetical protein
MAGPWQAYCQQLRHAVAACHYHMHQQQNMSSRWKDSTLQVHMSSWHSGAGADGLLPAIAYMPLLPLSLQVRRFRQKRQPPYQSTGTAKVSAFPACPGHGWTRDTLVLLFKGHTAHPCSILGCMQQTLSTSHLHLLPTTARPCLLRRQGLKGPCAARPAARRCREPQRALSMGKGPGWEGLCSSRWHGRPWLMDDSAAAMAHG